MKTPHEKPLEWRGSSLEDLKAFPEQAIRHFGFELHAIQHGLEPTDWKPMQNLGSGVMELRKKLPDGAYRVVYVAKFTRAIFVLHAFQKKTQATARRDIAIIKAQYQALRKELDDEN